MKDKVKNIIIIVITLLVSICLGYAIMYIKTPNDEKVEKQIQDEELDIKSINFSNFLYDIDGDEEREVSVKVLNQKAYLGIDGKEYPLKSYEKVTSVRVEHTTKNGGYNIIYILSNSLLYYISDLDYMEALKNNKDPEFKIVEIENISAIATMNETNKEEDYTYPTVYLKTMDGTIYYSQFDGDYVVFEE